MSVSIQQQVDNQLEGVLASRGDTILISNLRFIKAEMQRGKSKVIEDREAIDILVKLERAQREIVSQSRDVSVVTDAINLIELIDSFIPNNILEQLYATEAEILIWIQKNVDFSRVKNYNQIIGIVKKEMPYIDGNLVKNVIQNMGK